MSDFTVLGYKDCQSAVADIYKSNAFKAAFVDGKPGIGKTAMAEYIQEDVGLAYRFIVKPGHHEPYDFHGLPVPDHETHTTRFYPSDDLLPKSDTEGGVLMVWDEIGDAMTPIQNLVCQAIFEGGIHGYVFPKNTYHLLTGNRISDRSGAQRVVTKLANRCARFTLEPLVQEVFDYGMGEGWAPSVLAFLKLRGMDTINTNDRKKNDNDYVATYFNSFDPNDPAQSQKSVFSSSRTWEATSRLINFMDRNNPGIADVTLLSRVAALLGSPVASAYVPFRSETLHMPDPDEIAKGKNVGWPKKQSMMWTLTISLVSRATKDNFETIYNWLSKGENKEFSILFVKQCFDTKAAKLIGPQFNKVLQQPDVKQALHAV